MFVSLVLGFLLCLPRDGLLAVGSAHKQLPPSQGYMAQDPYTAKLPYAIQDRLVLHFLRSLVKMNFCHILR